LRDEVLELLRHHHPAEESEAPDAGIAPPERLGPYRVLGLIGRGGMGVVYRAEREGGEPVALKVLDSAILSGRFLGRFRREVEALRRLDHPGVVRFLEAGSYDSDVGPRPYYVMELVTGVSLRDKARDPAWDERARIARLAEIAEALHHAHEQGVVHRDIKPENVVVTAAGSAKVLDFGIARIAAEHLRPGTLATGTGVLLGTVQYMSPEQAQGLSDEIDRRSDVYSLGVLAYELLSGELPYELSTRSVTRALVQVATEEPRPLGEVRTSLRGPIERVVARALRKRREDRYPTAAALASDLRRHLAGERVLTPGPGFTTRVRAFVRRRSWVVRAAALTVIGLLGAVTAGQRPGVAPEQAADADAATARACALLDSVDTRLHHGARTDESLARVLALVQEAGAEIERVGVRPFVPDLRRYCAWREGEARFFRASLDSDPDGYLEAAAAWEHARAPARPFPFQLLLPDTTVNIYPRIIRMWPQQADAAMAIAYGELTRDRQPAHYGRLGLRHASAAWKVFAREARVEADPLHWAPRTADSGIEARLLNDLGAATAAVGFFEDSLAFLDRGLALLRKAEQAGSLGDDLAALASLHHQFGQAWVWRARRLHVAADIDSAVARLQLALSERTLLPGNTSIMQTREVLAEALRLKARLDTSREPALSWIERSLETIREGLRSDALAGEFPRARLGICLAAALVDRAVATGDTIGLAAADSLLDAGQRLHPRSRSPVVHARIEREHGRIEAARWYLKRDARAWVAAHSHLAAACDALTEAQHKPFWLETTAATRWLAERRYGSPALSDPVFRP